MDDDAALPLLRSLLNAVVESGNPFYLEKLEKVGFTHFNSLTIQEFREQCPFTTKEEIAADHRGNPPFGSNLGKPIEAYSRVSRTSGTTGERIMWPDTDSGWGAMVEAWQKIYTMAGVTVGRDRIYFAFSFGPFIGFWTAFEAAAQMGCMVFPGGAAGSSERVDDIIATESTVLCCTPTYAQRLGQLMQDSGQEHGIKTVIVAGETGGSVEEVRVRISRYWNDAVVFDHHGMTEVGPVSAQLPGASGNLCLLPGFHYGEVIDPESGKEVAEGQRGELVLTTLRRQDSPVLRYRTGDLVRKKYYEIEGSQVLGFEGGILGRIDDMVVVRGVNLYPAAVDSVLCRFPEVENYQVVITSERSMHEVTVFVELGQCSSIEETISAVSESLRNTFALRLPVEIASPGSLPVSEFKAQRWLRQ